MTIRLQAMPGWRLGWHWKALDPASENRYGTAGMTKGGYTMGAIA